MPADREVLQNSTILFDQENIEHNVAAMATRIDSQLADSDPIVVKVLNGGCATAHMLGKYLTVPYVESYIHATRYGMHTNGGTLEFKAPIPISVVGRTVLLVDDILDKGVTLGEIVKHVKSLGAKEVYTAVLLNKRVDRAENGLAQADFHALEVGDQFIYGCGMDLRGYYRNLPEIRAINPDYIPIYLANAKIAAEQEQLTTVRMPQTLLRAVQSQVATPVEQEQVAQDTAPYRMSGGV